MRPDPYLPWPGNPRRFYAMAMPNGDKRIGDSIEGPLVFVREQRVGLEEPGTIYTRAEAEALYDELGRALRAFGLAKSMAQSVACDVADRARPYLGPYPIRGKTLADVDADKGREAA